MSKTGVKIDLSMFFEDERKMVFVMVDPKWENVECLQKRVECLFELDSVRFLNKDGYFLPPQESIEIIQFCSGLKAFVPTESLDKKKQKKSKKNKPAEIATQGSENEESNYKTLFTDVQKVDDCKKKRKFYSLESGCTAIATPVKVKRLKISKNAIRDINKSNEITSTSEHMPGPTETPSHSLATEVTSKKSKDKKYKGVNSSDYEESALDRSFQKLPSEITNKQDLTEIKIAETNDKLKKRQTSTPKEFSKLSKNGLDITTSNEEIPAVALPSSIPSSTFLNESKMLEQRKNSIPLSHLNNSNNPFKKPHSKSGHIYFNNSGEIVSSTATALKSTPKKAKESKTLVAFSCSLSEVTNGLQTPRPRIFHIKQNCVTKNNKEKNVVEIQEEIVLVPAERQNETVTKPINEQQENIEKTKNDETDCLNTLTDGKILDKTNNQTTEDNVDVTKNEEMEGTSLPEENASEEPTKLNETSIMSVDCVDLSIDADEDDNEIDKYKKDIKHDLTVDDQVNDTSSDVEEISEIIDLNETEDNCEITLGNSTRPLSLDDISATKILPFCTKMSNLPNLGDIIVFKLPYKNQQKYAETNYFAGKAEYINKRTKTIKILILDGIQELYNVPDRYLCNFDDSQEYTKYVQLKLNEMLEPKLFAMSEN